VRKLEGSYEILVGYNQMNTIKPVGLESHTTIVKQNTFDKEAYVCLIERNLIQQSFAELLSSKKTAVLSEKNDKILYQRKCDNTGFVPIVHFLVFLLRIV
jgi:hypothetical protein